MKLKDVISTADMERCGERTLPVLSMTMHDGIVLQADRFKKAIASKDLSSYKVVRRNQLVVSFPIDEGVLYIQDLVDAGIVSPAYAIWDIHANMVYPRYLGMFLRSPRSIQYYKSKLRGSTARRRTIPREDFLCMELPEVSIAEQRKICATLETIKIVISECEQQINRLGEIVKSRFVEMFGDVAINPNGFDHATVKDVCESFFWIMPQTPEYIEGSGIPYITSKNIKNGKVDFTGCKYISSDDYNELTKNRAIMPGDFLISMIGTLGEVSIVKDQDGEFYGQNIFLLRLKDSVDSRYVFSYLTGVDYVKHWWDKCKNTSTQSYLKSGHITGLKILLPPLALQREFAAFVEKVDKLAFAVRKSLESAEKLYRQQLSEAFA